MSDVEKMQAGECPSCGVHGECDHETEDTPPNRTLWWCRSCGAQYLVTVADCERIEDCEPASHR